MEDFGGTAKLRYVDFDSPELKEYPEVYQRVTEGRLEPGMLMIGEKLLNIWEIPYSRMLVEFERMGARKAS
ncbi:MAG: hypothetical protein ACYCXU_08910 [Thermoleophilia bacterium]|jgi:hypothetical protein|nr:hypothetical protein [Actinomycetota bacterium]MCL6093145.1 hypothetical protein [Actinomycetota bacterium]MDA8167217.1 hypothetical protein [Actinomycetota bacterium]